MWLNGALTDRSWRDVWVAAPLVALGVAVLWRSGRSLDALMLGEPVARSLGVDTHRLLWLLIAGVGLTVGASVVIKPDVDGGEQPVEGTIWAANEEEVTVLRQDPDCGDICVHFPRAGYRIDLA